MDFSKKLYFLLSKNKLTQEEFAKKINSRRQVVGRWLAGTKPSAISIAKIAEALNTTPEELLSEKEAGISEMDLLKRENELLKKENALLRKEIRLSKK